MTTFTLAPKGKKCPFGGFTKDCRDLVSEGTCEYWTHIEGRHPLTGETMNEWGCAFAYAWVFAAEAARNAHHARADTLTLRNMIFDPDVRARELAKTDEMKLIEAQTCKSPS